MVLVPRHVSFIFCIFPSEWHFGLIYKFLIEGISLKGGRLKLCLSCWKFRKFNYIKHFD